MPVNHSHIKAFTLLGEFIRNHFKITEKSVSALKLSGMHQLLEESIEQSLNHNPWFIRTHVEIALMAIGQMLTPDNLGSWLNQYQVHRSSDKPVPNIGVIMAGNIPAVGFHDFLCTLMAGARFTGKLSSDDPFLLPALAGILCSIDNSFADKIEFISGPLSRADAIIATGSNNTSRYFEYHYGRLPRIFRRNRNGVAVLTGKETQAQLTALAKDVFLHFGLGCRNVSKLFVPADYNFSLLLQAFNLSDYVCGHQPYMNNYKYYKALLGLQQQPFIDTGFLVLHNADAISSPVAALHYEFYNNYFDLEQHLIDHQDQIQCITGEFNLPFSTTGFGNTQQPGPGDYADGIDTMEFLLTQTV